MLISILYCYLGHKYQGQDSCGTSEKAQADCEGKHVDVIDNGVGEGEDDYQQQATQVGGQDYLSVVIEPTHFHFSCFESHYNSCSLNYGLVAIQHSQCDVSGSGGT